MTHKQHLVTLTVAERDALRARIAAGTAPARELARARVLLKADTGAPGPRWSDARIAEAVEVSARTVARVRADFAAGGMERALARQAPRRTYQRKLDGAGEAILVATACGTPPLGRTRWTLKLLAARLAEVEVVEGIAPMTVATVLKKTASNRTASNSTA